MTSLHDQELPPLFAGVDPADPSRGERIDVYRPPRAAGERRPAVVFVHGGPVPPAAQPRDWPGFAGYGALAVASGLVGVVVEHRLHSEDHYPLAADDVAAAVDEARAHDTVDPERVALWSFSGGGPLAVDAMRTRPSWLRCLVWTYPVLAPPPGWDGDVARFDAIAALSACGDLPLLLVRVEDEMPPLVPNQTTFVEAARRRGAGLDVIDVPGVVHGFEGLDGPPSQAHDAVRRAMAWCAGALTGGS